MAVFLDLKQAYDMCWREAAVAKLRKTGIFGRSVKYTESFIQDIMVRVQNENPKYANRKMIYFKDR